ncbi:Ras-related protein rab-21 [Temnothorax longispinosus]|uniref:Ras-related protein rab-21 n=1 Tax=Temnothorax longispinosus TaxID=300112 RepID=A0A4S2KFY6_9HYME|nr:Ras-related protein rab-21 [Temnothorax longispinosus]
MATMASPVVGYNFKVVLFGEECVGKTSVALRYIEDKFNDKHISTLQIKMSFLNKKLNINEKRVDLGIWDQAGQEKFHEPIYYTMPNGAILVYDITNEDTFQEVKNWVKATRFLLYLV